MQYGIGDYFRKSCFTLDPLVVKIQNLPKYYLFFCLFLLPSRHSLSSILSPQTAAKTRISEPQWRRLITMQINTAYAQCLLCFQRSTLAYISVLVFVRAIPHGLHFKALLQIAHKYTYPTKRGKLCLPTCLHTYMACVWCASIFTAILEPIFGRPFYEPADVVCILVCISHIIWPASMRELWSKDKKGICGIISSAISFR